METLKLYLKDDCYYIQTEETELLNLRIQNQESVVYFNQVDSVTWSLSIMTLIDEMSIKQGDRGYIYYEDMEIKASLFEIQIESELEGIVSGCSHCMYVSFDDTVRIMFGEIPSARSYYESSQPLEIKTVSDGTLGIKLSVNTTYTPLMKMTFIASNRETHASYSVLTEDIVSQPLGDNRYRNESMICLDLNTCFEQVTPHLHYLKPDTTIFDFFLTIEVPVSHVTAYKFRVPFHQDLPSLTWTNYLDDQVACLNWYPTATYGNLSARLSFLHKDVVIEYQESAQRWRDSSKKDTKIVLISEYVHKAQDNGLALFVYLMEHHTEFTPYYILADDSQDKANVMPYKENVIGYRSKEHVRLFFEASYLAHTHASSYAMPIISKDCHDKRIELKKVFLQHGVLLMKNVEYLYGRKSNPDFTNAFIVSSERKKKIVSEEYFYPEDEIKVTGLSRFDTLLKGANLFQTLRYRKRILIIPTWRKELSYLDDMEFKKSDFYKNYMALINHEIVKKQVEKSNLQVTFYLHANFQRFSHLFSSDVVNIVNESGDSIQYLLTHNGILVTDYSSVSLDFSLLNRTVLFYQMEEKLFEQDKLDKASMEAHLPGPIYHNVDDIVHHMINKTTYNRLDKIYRQQNKQLIYGYNDLNASKRIVDVLRDL